MCSKTLAAIFVMAVVVACGPNSVIYPPTGPGTEYPCGLQGKSCDPVAPGKCCNLDEDCGYTGPWSPCPEGYCCYNGGEDTRYPGTSKPDAGTPGSGKKRPNFRQWQSKK